MHTSLSRWSVLLMSALLTIACRPGTPVLDAGEKPAQRDGTIAGHVLGPDGKSPVADRVVRAISLDSGRSYEARTNQTGGYTIQVPPGDYNVELTMSAGERLLKEPGKVHINQSDLDPNRDFVLGNPVVRSQE